MVGPLYRKNDEVFVFYRMHVRCTAARKYLAMLDAHHGAYRPRTGLAEGWVPARVTENQTTAGPRCNEVCVEYRWPHFFTKQGRMADSTCGWTEWYPTGDVMLMSTARGQLNDAGADGRRSEMLPQDVRPELAIVTFRWGGPGSISHCQQWGETGVSASDTFIESFVDSTVKPTLKHGYEVWVVYIEDHSDMLKVADMAHHMLGATHPARRAKNTVGMYFLYPTAFEEGCVPTMETGSDNGAGLVHQTSLFKMMRAVERAGIPTRFPHCSGLYEQLASKRWTHQLSLTPHLRVPPTVAVPRMLIERDSADAAAKAIATLNLVKKQQAKMRGEGPPAGVQKGVAKLGFSWEALDVKFWSHKDKLAGTLDELSNTIKISDEFTAQPHDCEALLVQEYVPHDFELRMYAVDGKVVGTIFTKFCKIKENQEFGDFEQKFTRQEAAKSWMAGDQEAAEEGEQQCQELTEHWLAWLQTQSCEVPSAVRFDYFVSRDGKRRGKAVVWTLEICELGFSMLGHQHLPQKVFAAMLRSCVGGDDSCRVSPPGHVSESVSNGGAANGSVRGGGGDGGARAGRSHWRELGQR
eukprot:TRINITY_DN19331_c0_g1_i1.p1 TRINITY_DN19331_c0_g1~~TRINITY_DN19331_c0_g1_i1.p1  ORF type:complete len:580 (-),score=89.20 TRINITY_DN19331_c0_g1_i1:59-1798(-)